MVIIVTIEADSAALANPDESRMSPDLPLPGLAETQTLSLHRLSPSRLHQRVVVQDKVAVCA